MINKKTKSVKNQAEPKLPEVIYSLSDVMNAINESVNLTNMRFERMENRIDALEVSLKRYVDDSIYELTDIINSSFMRVERRLQAVENRLQVLEESLLERV